MLTYKKVFEKDGIIRYEFYPEGNTEAPGIVEFEEGKAPRLIAHSSADFKMFYATHALNNIDMRKESGTVAWY